MKKITLTDFEKNQSKNRPRWMGWLALSVLLLIGKSSFAQVNAYSFSQSDGVYQSIATDGVLVSGSEANAVTTYDTSGWDVAIPFDFTYNALNYNSIYVNSNGGTTFGTTSTSSAVISTTTAYAGAIGVMNRDLWGIFYTSGTTTSGSNVITNVGSFKGIAIGKTLRTGSGVPAGATVTGFDEVAGTITMSTNATTSTAAGSYGWGTGKIFTKVEGVAPNRIFTIQWEGFNDYNTTGANSNYLSFQLKLTETSNTIQIVYGENFNLSITSRTNQVGLRGATNADFNNRLGAAGNPWNNTSAGTANNSSIARNNTNFPATGLTFMWTPSTCIPPSGLSATNITTTSATLEFVSLGSLFNLEYGPQGFVQGTGTTVTGISGPYSLTGILPNTSYSFYVRQDCGATDGLSNWAGPFTFITACNAVATFTEDFDSYTATGSANPLPNCWTRLGNTGSSYITTASNTPLSAPNRLFLSGSATTGTNGVAVMPPVSNLQAETHRLKFKAYSTTAQKFLEIGYYEVGGDVLNFIVLETFAMPSTALSTATEFIYTPQFVTAGVQSIAFRVNGGAFTGTTTIYIDDVVWEPIPACPDVTEIIIENLSATTADISWTPGGSETAWKYVFAESTVTDPNTLTPVDVTNNPFITLTNLTANTSYNFWVRSNCGPGSLGNWSTVETFTTLCSPVTNFFENFDSYTLTGSANPLPNCWVRAGNGFTYITTASITPMSPPNRLYMSANGVATTPTESIAMMPEVSNLAAGTHRLKFRAYATAANKTVEIGYYVNPSELNSYVSLQTINLTTTTAATAATYIYIPTGVPSGVTTLAFKNAGLPSSTTLYIDDVTWEPIPLCPDVNSVVFGTSTSTTATISWTPGGSETAWQYVYGLTTETNPLTLTPIIDVTGTPQATITGLLPATNYKVWVRSVCGTNLGAFSTPATFITACEPAATFSQNFDTSPTGTTVPLPICWNRAGNGTVNVTTGGIAPGSAPNRLYMFANGTLTTPTVAIAMMPPVSNLQAATHQLKFKAYATAVDRAIEIGYFTDITDLSTFVLVQNIQLPGTLAASALEFNVAPTNIPTGITTLAFRNTGLPASTAVYIDDVIWELKPLCADVNIPSLTSTTATTATIAWNAAGSGTTTWEYAIGAPTVTDPLTLAPVEVSGTPQVTIPGLLPATNYKVWVRSKCGTAFGSYSPALTFTTDCEPAATFSQNFDTSVTGSTAPLPLCWIKAGNGSTYPTTGGASPGSAPNRLYMFANGTLTVPTVAIAMMPPVSNLQAATHQLKFKAYATAINRSIEIGYFTDPADLSTFVLVQNIELPSTNAASALEFIIAPANIPTGITTLAFRNTGLPASTTVYIDDVIWELKPLCADVNSPSLTSTTDTSATITWNAAGSGTTTWEYAIGAPTVTDPLTLTPVQVTGTPQATINGLLSATNYKVWVRSVCGTEFGSYSPALTFTTACATFSVPFVQDFTTFVPNCWTTADAGTVATGPTGSAAGIWLADGFLNVGSTAAIKVNLYSTNRIGWIVTPAMATTIGNSYTLSFNYGVTAWNLTTPLAMGSDDFVKVVRSTDNGVTWTEIQSFTAASNVSNTSQLYTYDYVATTSEVKFALYASDGTVNDSEDYDFFVDTVGFESALSNVGFIANSFIAYPNPVKDNLTVRYNENITDVSIYNLLGQQLFVININATEGKVDMSNLSAGTYLIRVNSGDKSQTIKVIKE